MTLTKADISAGTFVNKQLFIYLCKYQPIKHHADIEYNIVVLKRRMDFY